MDEGRNIPAELKRLVLVEAGHRCAIPACREQANVEIHHIEPYSKVKKHELGNLIALCPNCHAQADRNRIDKAALLMYKDNLRFVNEKYSPLEVDILIDLSQSPKGLIGIPPYMGVLVKRLIEDELIQIVEAPKAMSVTYDTSWGPIELKQNPDILLITPKGRLFVDQLSSEDIGYNRPQ
ncbi:MAG: HNH endonuclease [Halobacteriota archaeon]